MIRKLDSRKRTKIAQVYLWLALFWFSWLLLFNSPRFVFWPGLLWCYCFFHSKHTLSEKPSSHHFNNCRFQFQSTVAYFYSFFLLSASIFCCSSSRLRLKYRASQLLLLLCCASFASSVSIFFCSSSAFRLKYKATQLFFHLPNPIFSPQKGHLIDQTWISSAQKGHFFCSHCFSFSIQADHYLKHYFCCIASFTAA